MIELQELTKRYGSVTAVERLSLAIGRGELLVLLGGSGCGKTTTLKMVNRLIEPSAGRVLIDGRAASETPPHELRRRIGYCFQQVGLFPHMTVAENIAVTPRLLGWERARIARRVTALLELVGLDPAVFRGRLPHALSGGQQQRVGVARALAAEPDLLLLDEPFGALDPLTRNQLQESFREIRTRLGLTAIFVTHDVVEALLLADRIAVMQTGRLLQVGTPADLLHRPAADYVRDLMATPLRRAREVAELARDDDGISGRSS
jgi:osmoprotectant transport system ATP-binding protein